MLRIKHTHTHIHIQQINRCSPISVKLITGSQNSSVIPTACRFEYIDYVAQRSTGFLLLPSPNEILITFSVCPRLLSLLLSKQHPPPFLLPLPLLLPPLSNSGISQWRPPSLLPLCHSPSLFPFPLPPISSPPSSPQMDSSVSRVELVRLPERQTLRQRGCSEQTLGQSAQLLQTITGEREKDPGKEREHYIER